MVDIKSLSSEIAYILGAAHGDMISGMAKWHAMNDAIESGELEKIEVDNQDLAEKIFKYIKAINKNTKVYLNGKEITDEDFSVSFVKQEKIQVPGGDFLMGSTVDQLRQYYTDLQGWPPSCIDRERPQHTVNIDTFEIDKYPVTCGMYHRFCIETGHQRPSYWKGSSPPDKLIDHPVVHVTLMDAMAYCQWAGGRLPYETEWEKAARGTDGRVYPWGDEFDASRANIGKESDAIETTQVNAYPHGVSPYGAMDMVGNVHEWTNDVVTPYPGYSEKKWSEKDSAIMVTHIGLDGATKDSVFAPNTSTVRGGSVRTAPGLCRCSSRIDIPANVTMPDVGFRCVYATDPSEIGKRLFEDGNAHNALHYFEKALMLAPAHAGVLFNAAYCFQSVGQYTRAIQLWQQLVELWPADQDARMFLQECLHHAGASESKKIMQTTEEPAELPNSTSYVKDKESIDTPVSRSKVSIYIESFFFLLTGSIFLLSSVSFALTIITDFEKIAAKGDLIHFILIFFILFFLLFFGVLLIYKGILQFKEGSEIKMSVKLGYLIGFVYRKIFK